MSEAFEHLPVMAREVVEFFASVPAGLVVDCTIGGGGHAALILDARPDLTVLGIDRDIEAVAAARRHLARFGSRVAVEQGGFEEVADIEIGRAHV